MIPLFAYAAYTYVATARTLRDLESVRLVEREVAVGRALDDQTSASLDAGEDYSSWPPFLSALAEGDNTEVRRHLETLAATPGALAQVYTTDGDLLVSGGGGVMASPLWRLPEVQRLTEGLSGGEPVAGFETVDGGLWVIGAEYLHDEGTRRPLGVLVTARPLDEDTLTSIGAATDVTLTPATEAEAEAAGTDQTAGAASGVLYQVGAPFDEGAARSVYLAVYDADGYRSGLVKVSMDRSMVLDATADLRDTAAAVLLLALAASVVAAVLLSRRITLPLRRLATAAVAIAGGRRGSASRCAARTRSRGWPVRSTRCPRASRSVSPTSPASWGPSPPSWPASTSSSHSRSTRRSICRPSSITCCRASQPWCRPMSAVCSSPLMTACAWLPSAVAAAVTAPMVGRRARRRRRRSWPPAWPPARARRSPRPRSTAAPRRCVSPPRRSCAAAR